MTEETPQDRLKAKVAAILSQREVVINRGLAAGVQVGMRFAILNSAGVNIRDPDTNEVIDSIEVVKAVVKVVRLTDRTSVGRTFRTIPGKPGIYGGLSGVSGFLGTPARVETLDIKSSSLLKRELSEEDSYIKVGDTAVHVINDDYSEAE